MALNEMTNITSNGTTAAVRLGLASTKQTYYPTVLTELTLTVSGTVGTSPAYGIDIQDRNGDWIAAPDFSLTDKGTATALVECCAYRGNFTNGSGSGSGANAPRYLIQARPLNQTMSLGDYAG